MMKKVLLISALIITGLFSMLGTDYWTGVKIYNNNDNYVKIYSETFDSIAYVKKYKIEPTHTPEATMVPNTTIAQIKQMITAQCGNSDNGAVLLGEKDNGEHYIIHGYVISSDKNQNLYRTLVIQDETAAIPLMVRVYNLWLTYEVGQEVMVDVTGLYIGKYMGDYEIGAITYYEGEPEIIYLEPDVFLEHLQCNGNPNKNMAYVDYNETMQLPTGTPYCIRITVEQLQNLYNSSPARENMMGQLIQVSDVSFEDAGKETFAYFLSSTTRYILDGDGNYLATRNSGYSEYFDEPLPGGQGTLTGILNVYSPTGWQLLTRSAADIDFLTFTYPDFDTDCWTGLNTYRNNLSGYHIPTAIIQKVETFQEPVPENPGTGAWDSPYLVPQILHGVEHNSEAWVTGYIVGYIQVESMTVLSAKTAVFASQGAPTYNLLLAADPDEKDWGKCIPVQLSANQVRQDVSLYYNPENLGKEVSLKGEVGTNYLGTKGLRTVNLYNWGPEGVEVKDPFEGGTLYLSTNMDGFTEECSVLPEGKNSVWSWEKSFNYASANSYNQGNVASEGYLISPEITLGDNTDVSFSQAINYLRNYDRSQYLNVCVRVKGSTAWQTVQVDQWPAGDNWTFLDNCKIDLSAFAGMTVQIGFHYVSSLDCCPAWEVKNLFVK